MTLALPPSLAPHLLSWLLLPSRTLHPARAHQLWPQDKGAAALYAHPRLGPSLERQRSAQLLALLSPEGIEIPSWHETALPLASAPAPLFTSLQRHAGLLLLGGHIRRTIARSHVLALEIALGLAALQWTREQAPALHPGLIDVVLTWHDNDLVAHTDLWGACLLAQSWSDASAPLRQRANWRLPEEATTEAARARCTLSPPAARALCLRLLHSLDDSWLSFFPATP